MQDSELRFEESSRIPIRGFHIDLGESKDLD